jgi:ubiquinone/menaquinone biosynthesis C-methylase UbiE
MSKPFLELEFADETAVEFWDKLYDRQDFYGSIYRQRAGSVLTWLEGLQSHENVCILDIGCGAGRFAHEAAKRGFSVFAMDNSHGMVVKANSNCNRVGEPKVIFLQGNIEAIPLQNSSFDVIVCLGVIGYIKHEDEVLKGLARVLRPDGILFISIVNKARLVSRLDLTYFLMNRLRKAPGGRGRSRNKGSDINQTPFYKTYLVPRFKKTLELAGFTVPDYKTVPLRLLTINGKEVFPRKTAEKITMFFEKFYHVPIIGSFGGMCIFRAQKNQD